jgi:hypothetical protein
MSLYADMNTALRLTSEAHTIRRLCCPECGGNTSLRRDDEPDCKGAPLYWCRACLSEFEALAALERKAVGT